MKAFSELLEIETQRSILYPLLAAAACSLPFHTNRAGPELPPDDDLPYDAYRYFVEQIPGYLERL